VYSNSDSVHSKYLLGKMLKGNILILIGTGEVASLFLWRHYGDEDTGLLILKLKKADQVDIHVHALNWPWTKPWCSGNANKSVPSTCILERKVLY
jgi:hypothetical protein